MKRPAMRSRRHALGMMGEEVAAAYLEGAGVKIVERRFRRRGGEIDLICCDRRGAADGSDGELVFVEVKARSSLSYGRPESSVSSIKKSRLRRTAEIYLAEKGIADRLARFDVISILFDGSEVRSLEYYADAFGLSGPDSAVDAFWF